ncbi:MAG TPA: hypothetical protein GX691_07810 [Clostridia bacterium]|jgi:5-methylcytosine-specific restriction endonuclease McrA|nr:hypothetical protein [Clostridia bacterium]
MGDFKVLRLVTQGELSWEVETRYQQCYQLTRKTCKKIKDRVTVFQAPGGFLFDIFEIAEVKHWPDTDVSEFTSITEYVDKTLSGYFFDQELKSALKEKADFFTFGVDVFDVNNDKCFSHVELVATYDTKLGKVSCWTGKSYPTEDQKRDFINCPSLETHCQRLNGIRVLVLGCHDLNMFSPRSRASIAPGTSKEIVINQMQKLCDQFKPQVVLQHPHATDSANIWNAGWAGVRKFLPEVKTYSSAIHYFNTFGGEPRQPLTTVLNRTATRDVQNIVFTCFEDGGIDLV